MTEAGDPTDELDRLPADTRAGLNEFSRALARLHVEDLVLYVASARQPRHRRAVETAEIIAIEVGLVGAVEAARRVIIEQIVRAFAVNQFQGWIDMAPNLGSLDDRVVIARSVGEAVTALVLGDRLDADTRGELLGLWDRLLP
jgi:hypothetical protein